MKAKGRSYRAAVVLLVLVGLVFVWAQEAAADPIYVCPQWRTTVWGSCPEGCQEIKWHVKKEGGSVKDQGTGSPWTWTWLKAWEAGDFDLECSCDGGGTWKPVADFNMIVIEIKADNNLSPPVPAATVYEGTSSSPKTLLAGMNFVWVAGGNVRSAKIDLSAYSDVELEDQDFVETPEWTVSGPSPGNFSGNDPEDPREKTGVDVVYYAAKEGLYTFTCTVKVCSKTIDVYVAYPHIDENPEYMFADAGARIPLGFTIMGIGTNYAKIKTDSDLNEFRLRYYSNELETYFDLSYVKDLDSDKFAPEWTDTETKNGESASYKIVSEPGALSGIEMTGTAGLSETGYLSMCCEALVVLPDDEETNYAWLVTDRIDYDDVTDVKIVDKRWHVTEIDEDKTVVNNYVCSWGTGRYYHMASDDNNYECAGWRASDGQSGDFVAGDDEKYNEVQPTGDNYHYHAGDTSETTGGPRGFHGEGEGEDIALAGMTKKMASDGLIVEARLFDDTDIPSSDDEEEYLAKAIAGSITSTVTIGYKRRGTPAGHFGEFYDLRSGEDDGSVYAKFLPDSLIKLNIDESPGDVAPSYLGAALDGAGLCLSVAGGVICIATGPPGWVVGLSVAAIVVSTGAVLNDIDGFTAYDDQAGFAIVKYMSGKMGWDEGELSVNHIKTTAVGATELGIGTGGLLSAAASVVTGDQLRSGLEIVATAQNESAEMGPTDVHTTVKLERKEGNTSNLRSVVYEWE